MKNFTAENQRVTEGRKFVSDVSVAFCFFLWNHFACYIHVEKEDANNVLPCPFKGPFFYGDSLLNVPKTQFHVQVEVRRPFR
jgi:hypothetical protein